MLAPQQPGVAPYSSPSLAIHRNPIIDRALFIQNTTKTLDHWPSFSVNENKCREKRIVKRARSVQKGELESALGMTASISIVQLGYEIGRTSVLSLFLSEETGFTNLAALPLALTCVSPFSVLLLSWSGCQLQRYGPRRALRRTTLFSASVYLSACWFFLRHRRDSLDPAPRLLQKVVLSSLFLFQHTYAHLHSSQGWSMVGSLPGSSTHSNCFSYVNGIISLSSGLGAASVSSLLKIAGLPGLLGVTGLTLIVGAALSDWSYSILAKNDIEVEDDSKNTSTSKAKHEEPSNAIHRSFDLFRRVPLLNALMYEVLASQTLSALLQFFFLSKMKTSFATDHARASFMGKFYAATYSASSILQFLLLPLVMETVEARTIWLVMPCIIVFATTSLCFVGNASIGMVSIVFFITKAMEYSIRTVAAEQAFLPLDFESRFIGRQMIKVFGYMTGKSLPTFLLFSFSQTFGAVPDVYLSITTNVSAVLWMISALRVGDLVSSTMKKNN